MSATNKESTDTPAQEVRALLVMNQEDGGFDCLGSARVPDGAIGVAITCPIAQLGARGKGVPSDLGYAAGWASIKSLPAMPAWQAFPPVPNSAFLPAALTRDVNSVGAGACLSRVLPPCAIWPYAEEPCPVTESTASSGSGSSPVTSGSADYPDHDRAIRLYGEQLAGDPAELYRGMRSEFGSVAPILLDGDIPAWFVLGYREMHLITSSPQLFARDCRRWNAWDRIPADWPLMPFVGWAPSVMFAEGSEHQRRAGAIGDALDAVDRTDLARICEQVSDQLIDGFTGNGEADLVADYANQIPMRVIAPLFGLPESDTPALVQDIADSLDVAEKANAAHQRNYVRMQELVAARHDKPGRDVPSRMIAHPSGLADDEIIIDLLVVMAAAQQPTANWIGNALRLMLIDDQFSLTLQGGRSSVGQALTEVLWKDTPTQNFIGRWAVQDCDLGGRRVRKGDLLVLGLAAANADPRVRPSSFADTGMNRAHMSFGHGEHGCPYPAPELAEIIARTAVEVLLDRIPDVMLAVGGGELRWRPSLWMRGLYSLPVKFSPDVRVTPRLA
jgi:cytochrome P450